MVVQYNHLYPGFVNPLIHTYFSRISAQPACRFNLLVGILDLDYGLNQRISLKRAVGTILCMLTGVIMFGILPLHD